MSLQTGGVPIRWGDNRVVTDHHTSSTRVPFIPVKETLHLCMYWVCIFWRRVRQKRLSRVSHATLFQLFRGVGSSRTFAWNAGWKVCESSWTRSNNKELCVHCQTIIVEPIVSLVLTTTAPPLPPFGHPWQQSSPLFRHNDGWRTHTVHGAQDEED